jgi:outer membrane lipase/esterase
MKKAPLHIALALMLGLGSISAASAKSLFDNFYFFGDSLTDMGNMNEAPVTSGGSTWANYFAQKYGNNASPSNNGGNDYAQAGALTAMVAAQLNTYLASVNNRVDPNALYSIWAGANDINIGLQFGETPAEIIGIGVGNTNLMVQELHAAGAKYIMVFNLPDLGRTPLGQSQGAFISSVLSQITQAYNSTLASTLNADGFNVIQLDIYSLFNDLLNDPAHFGLANAADLFYTPQGGDPNLDQHPTGYGHQMIADYAFSVIEGPTRAAILAEAPFGVMDSQNINIENQLYNIRTGFAKLSVGQTTSFASASYTPYSQEGQSTAGPGFDANATDLTVGLVHRINNNVLLGAGLAHSFGHVDFGQHTGGTDMNENMGSVFASYQYKGFYTDAMANYGVIDYSRVTRKITIGISDNSASGNTEGSQVGGNLVIGYNIINCPSFQTGPLVNVDYQFIRVKGYQETGTIDGIAEQFDNQTNESLLTSAGWQLAYHFDVNNLPVMPFAQLTYNHQMLNRDRDVGAGLVSIPGSHFTIPISSPDKDYGLASAGVSFGISKDVSFSLGYQTTLFYSGNRSQNANASIQVLL